MNKAKNQVVKCIFTAPECCAAVLAAAGFRLRRRTEKCRRRPPGLQFSPVRRDEIPETDIERAVQALESEAVRRALSGVAVPVFHQGRECGSTVKHSDQLLMFLLKTLNPERFAVAKDAPKLARRAFALDIDLSAADSQDADEGEETPDAGQ
jgi:hypothetical protein